MSKFFINRPIVAMVIAILMVIVGGVTIASLPVAQFPDIAPPEIRLQAAYTGADALALEQAVDTPIEEQINGVDNMTYMYSLNATANTQTPYLLILISKRTPTQTSFSPNHASNWPPVSFHPKLIPMGSPSKSRRPCRLC
jgi:HAE1 family hydrophobic/amphiphilic exporter-1